MFKNLFALVIFLFFTLHHLIAAPSHGISLSALRYPANFTHFDYANPDAPKGGTLIMSAVGGFDSLNPFTVMGEPAAGMSVIHPSYLYATLTKHSLDEPIAAYGYVAKDMEVVDGGAGVVYTLRDEAKFHDDSPITPDDVVFTFDTFKAKGHIFFKQYYREIVKAEKLGNNQVKFSFKNNMNKELPIIIGEMPILSKSSLQNYDITKSSLKSIMGSGPYKIKSFKQGDNIEYERVKNWWGENLPVNKGHYNTDGIKIIYFMDQVTQFEAFKSGGVDIRIENIAKNWATGYNFPLLKKGTVIKETIKHSANQGFQGIEFNLRNPIFNNNNLRKALSLAYDFEWANKNLFFNLYKRCKSYFANSEFASIGKPTGRTLEILNKYKDKIKPDSFTTDVLVSDHSTSAKSRLMFHQARKLLTDGGYKIIKKNGKPLLIDHSGQPVILTMLLPQQDNVRAFGKYQQDLQNWLGIELRFKVPADVPTYTRLLDKFDYDMVNVREGQSESPGNEQFDMWGSQAAKVDGSRNYSGISDPAVDAIIQEIVDADTREHLVAATKALDWLLLHQYLGVPGYYNDGYWISYQSFLKRPKISPVLGITLDTWWINKK